MADLLLTLFLIGMLVFSTHMIGRLNAAEQYIKSIFLRVAFYSVVENSNWRMAACDEWFENKGYMALVDLKHIFMSFDDIMEGLAFLEPPAEGVTNANKTNAKLK